MDLSPAQRTSSSNAASAARPLPRIVVATLLGIVVAFVISVTQSPGTFDRTTAAGILTTWPSKHRVATADAVEGPAARLWTKGASTPIEATVVRLADLGMRNIVVCLASGQATSLRPMSDSDLPRSARVTQLVCDGATSRIEATAASIAASGAQAVVFDCSTEDARTFVEALRARGSFAMVVLTPAVDAKRLPRMLSRGAATWLAVVEAIPSPAGAQRDAPGVRLGMLTQNGVIVY